MRDARLSNVARWLRDVDAAPTIDEASASAARERVRDVGAGAGLPRDAIAALATATSELAHNQLRHARGGFIGVRPTRRGDVAGVEVIAADAGPGIADAARAITGDGGSRRGGLGVGLASVLSLCDEVDFDVRLGEGTCVWARKFAADVARRRQVAILSRPIAGERVSGDDAAFVQIGDALLVAAADGLGHGTEAREASARSIAGVLRAATGPIDALFAAIDPELRDTRGAVLSVARLEDGELRVASVGNVTVQSVGRAGAHRFGGRDGFLGQSPSPRAPVVERASLAARDAVVLFTDGLASKLGLVDDADLLREPAITIAATLLDRYGKAHDDALIVVVR